MNLIFQRGDRESPVGHALIYFQGDSGAILASYVSVPPIKFDLSSYMPGFLAGAMQGLDLGNAMVATPMPPIPEEVPSVEYLRDLAERRQDDLIYAGGAVRSEPMMLAQQTAEAAGEYGRLYTESPLPEGAMPSPPAPPVSRFADLSEGEKLNALTSLTGRLRDSLSGGRPDMGIVSEMQELADSLPAKYRVSRLISAAQRPGETGQHLAQLYLERCFKLFREEYLDLERIDREIDTLDH